jgi:hypothetical protein
MAGLADIGFMVWCIVHQTRYSSSFNVFAVIAGIFLVRGNLKAARIVSFFAAFFIAVFLVLMIAALFFIPFDLVITYLKLHPLLVVLLILKECLVFIMLIFIYKQLTSPRINAAMDEIHIDHTSFRKKPASGFRFGGCLATIILVFLAFFVHGSSGEQAKKRAAALIGPGYKFVVTSLSVSDSDGTKHFHAIVTAYNDKNIKELTVQWEK